MIDDDLVLRVERLRDALEDFKLEIRKRYRRRDQRVGGAAVQTRAAQIAERWLVDIADSEDVRVAITDDVLAELNVHFQRLLTYSERTVTRDKYDATVASILRDFRSQVVVPLKQNRGLQSHALTSDRGSVPLRADSGLSAFVGQSFEKDDQPVNELIQRLLRAYGVTVTTGERPRADSISAKVKALIDDAELFVGIFTRRDKLAGGKEWVASAWVIDEKAYALAKNKRLILLKEVGVKSVGGLQGDYEYLEFDRREMSDLLVRLLDVLVDLRG